MFCEHMVRMLGLENVEVIKGRGRRNRTTARASRKYDWAVARAVANMNVLSEYLLPLLKWADDDRAKKAKAGRQRAQSAEKAMKLLGGKLKQVVPVNLPGVADDRYLVLVDKSAATPPRYPRKAGMPAKQPL